MRLIAPPLPGVAAFEQDHHLLFGGVNPVLQFYELRLQAEQLLEIVAAIIPFASAVGTAVGKARQRVVILDVHFDFLIPAIRQITADALDELFGIERGQGAHAGSGC